MLRTECYQAIIQISKELRIAKEYLGQGLQDFGTVSARYTYSMDLQDLIRKNLILKNMVDITLPTAESDPLHNTSSYVYRLVRSVLRKNIMRLQAIHVLNNFDKMSDSSLEIVRNMIEDSISFSYILSSDDPEKQAHTFFEFRHVQAKQDLDYYS